MHERVALQKYLVICRCAGTGRSIFTMQMVDVVVVVLACSCLRFYIRGLPEMSWLQICRQQDPNGLVICPVLASEHLHLLDVLHVAMRRVFLECL